MALPFPEAGLVIHFNYLWNREAQAGRDNAKYARPCAIVLTYSVGDRGREVVVAPVTHSAPHDPATAIELPAAVKRHLGLDDERSWIVLNELNVFIWPGHDLEPNAAGEFAYGLLPGPLFKRVKAKVVDMIQQNRLSPIVR